MPTEATTTRDEKSADNLIKSIKKAVSDKSLAEIMNASNKLGSGMGIERMKMITSTYPKILTNNWSKSGDEGNAITILKNGQNASITGPGFIPVADDINLDPTSIYLTSTQQIPIVVDSWHIKFMKMATELAKKSKYTDETHASNSRL